MNRKRKQALARVVAHECHKQGLMATDLFDDIERYRRKDTPIGRALRNYEAVSKRGRV